MNLLKVKKDETKAEYIKRFMDNKEMKKQFPIRVSRLSYAYQKYRIG